MTTAASLPRLLVFGEALTDFVRTGDNTWHSAAGGSGWNVARVAATLGLPTGWGGAVSNDLFGHEIVEKSKQANLDMRFLQVVEKPPFMAIVHQANPPDYFFLGTDTADLAFDERKLPDGWLDACEIAHFGCISLVRQPLAARLVTIAEMLKTHGAKISFDPNYRNLMGPDFPAFFERMASLSDIVKLSDEDMSKIYPRVSVADSLAHIRRLAPKALIVYTRGAEGLALYTPDGVFEQPAYPVTAQPPNTVGAGDSCIGGFITSMLSTPDAGWQRHVQFAAATAAVVCEHVGAYAPSALEVETRIGAAS
jgi:fructokinase